MGYSIGVRARSQKLQQTMLAFLKVHYRNWAQITGGYDPQSVSDPEREDAGEITRRQWLDEHKALMAKHFKPLMDRALGLMRTELQRLDQLWEFG